MTEATVVAARRTPRRPTCWPPGSPDACGCPVRRVATPRRHRHRQRCASSAAAARSTWCGPDGDVATLSQPGQPDRRITPAAPRARRVPRRRAAPARPRRDLRGRAPHGWRPSGRRSQPRGASRQAPTRECEAAVGWRTSAAAGGAHGRPQHAKAAERRRWPQAREPRHRARTASQGQQADARAKAARGHDDRGQGDARQRPRLPTGKARQPRRRRRDRRSPGRGPPGQAGPRRRRRGPARHGPASTPSARAARPHVALTGGSMGSAIIASLLALPGAHGRRLVAGPRLVGRRALPAGRRPRPQRHPERRGRASARSASTRPRCTGSPDPTRPRAPRPAPTAYARTIRRARPEACSTSCSSASVPTATSRRSSRTTRPSGSQTPSRSPCTTRPSRRPTGFASPSSASSAADEVWFLVAGDDKADAVTAALAPDADRWDVPAAGPRGSEATLWLVDAPAASGLD